MRVPTTKPRDERAFILDLIETWRRTLHMAAENRKHRETTPLEDARFSGALDTIDTLYALLKWRRWKYEDGSPAVSSLEELLNL